MRRLAQGRRLFSLVIFFGGAILPVSACSTSAARSSSMEGDLKTLTVFAAASLSEAFTSLGDKFEASHPEAHVVFNYAGSQQLAQQLAQGAPADVFASANQEQMEAVIEQGRISPDSQQILAHNRLVVVAYPQAADGVRRLQDLAEPGTIVVLAGEAVPVGKYAREFIAKAGQEPAFGPAFEQAALKNVVSFEENVRAVFSKVILGEADAGIVYASDAAGVSPQQVRVLEIPDNLNVQASYYIAPTEDSAEPDLAKKFIDFLLTNEGQQVLTDHGFLPARQP